MADRPVPVDADADQRERAEEDGDRLRVADERAERAAERPVLEEDVGDEGERDANGRHQDVGAGEVHDEPVGDRSHASVGGDDGDDDRIAAYRYDDDGQVDGDQQDARVDRKQVRADDDRRVTVRHRRRVVSIHDCSN